MDPLRYKFLEIQESPSGRVRISNLKKQPAFLKRIVEKNSQRVPSIRFNGSGSTFLNSKSKSERFIKSRENIFPVSSRSDGLPIRVNPVSFRETETSLWVRFRKPFQLPSSRTIKDMDSGVRRIRTRAVRDRFFLERVSIRTGKIVSWEPFEGTLMDPVNVSHNRFRKNHSLFESFGIIKIKTNGNAPIKETFFNYP